MLTRQNIPVYIFEICTRTYADSVALSMNEIRHEHPVLYVDMGWLRLVGSLKLKVSCAKKPYKRNDILQKRLIIVRSLLIVATPCMYINIYVYTCAHTYIYAHILVLCAYVNIHVYINANIRMYMYTRITDSVELFTNERRLEFLVPYVYMHINIHLHTYAHL